uniref:GvpN protein n=2 Tax=Halorubrum vacuolatum TaxID=63740 RepID=O33399_HALVU|nr:gvpN [Halorubrum vacuolatum]
MSDRSHNRKVRGSKIRASRKEKQQKSRRQEQKEIDRLEKQKASKGQSQQARKTVPLDTTFISSEHAFIETDEVNRLRHRVERWLKAGRPTHLIGPTGCGKTALAMYIARERDRPVVWINGDADLTTSDLIGDYAEKEKISEHDKYIHNVLKSKEVVRDRWVDNPLTIAAKEGATLVYNEFSRTKPIANNVLLSVFEEGVLELPGQHGESRYVDVHPEFRAILTSNSVEYAGVHKPQDALLDRLIGIYMDFYDAETEAEILRTHLDEDELSDDRITEIVTLIREFRERLDITVGTRAAIMIGEGVSVVEDPTQAELAEICVDVLTSKVSEYSEVEALHRDIEDTIQETEVSIS